MSRKSHYLKILPKYYIGILRGEKTFVVMEKKDHDIEVHDLLHLLEYDPEGGFGNEIVTEVSYVLDAPEYCKEGFVILGIKNIVIKVYSHVILGIDSESIVHLQECC